MSCKIFVRLRRANFYAFTVLQLFFAYAHFYAFTLTWPNFYATSTLCRTPTGINLEAVDEYATDSGAIVRSIEPYSNADGKGVYAGYVLMTVNDVDMSHASMQAIEEAIGTEPGNPVSLRFRPHANSAEAFGWGVNSMQ
jgi:hypothetical protein